MKERKLGFVASFAQALRFLYTFFIVMKWVIHSFACFWLMAKDWSCSQL